MVAMALLYPLEVVRLKLQIQVQKKSNGATNPTTTPIMTMKREEKEWEENRGKSIPNKYKHTCGLEKSTQQADECISPETPYPIASSSPPTTTDSDQSSTSRPPFALHAPKKQPRSTCEACIIESSVPAITSTTAGNIVKPATSSSITSLNSNEPAVREYKGSWDVIKVALYQDGWKTLYGGLDSALIGVGASSAVYFFWYYTFKSIVLAHTGKQTMGPLSNLGVASVAGVVNVFMTLPIWLVNTRMLLGRGQYSGVFDAIKKIHAEEGFGGFYRGLVPSLILVSNPAIQFVVYEQLVSLYTKAANKGIVSVAGEGPAKAVRLSSLQYFLLGAFAKAVATVASYPYQVSG